MIKISLTFEYYNFEIFKILEKCIFQYLYNNLTMSYSLMKQRKSKPKYNKSQFQDRIRNFPFTNKSIVEQIYHVKTPRLSTKNHKSPRNNPNKISQLSSRNSQNTHRDKKQTLEDSLNAKLAQKSALIFSQERQLRSMMRKVQQLQKEHELILKINTQKSAETQKSLIKELSLLKETINEKQYRIKILSNQNQQLLQKQSRIKRLDDEIIQQNNKLKRLAKQYKQQIQRLSNKDKKYEQYIHKLQRQHEEEANLYQKKVNEIKYDFDKMHERMEEYKRNIYNLKQQNKQIGDQNQQLKLSNRRSVQINEQLNWQMSQILKVVEKDFKNFGKKCTTAQTILQIQKQKLQFYQYTAKENQNIISLLKGKLEVQTNDVNHYNNSIVQIMKHQIENMKTQLKQQLADQSLKHQSNQHIIDTLNQKQIQLQNTIKNLEQTNLKLQNNKKQLSITQKEEISHKFVVYLRQIDQLKTINKSLVFQIQRLKEQYQQSKLKEQNNIIKTSTSINTEINNQEFNNYEKYSTIQANLWAKINILQSQILGNIAETKAQKQKFDKTIQNKNEIIAFFEEQIVKLKQQLEQKNQLMKQYWKLSQKNQNNKENIGKEVGFCKIKQQDNFKILNEFAIKTINLEAKNLQTFQEIKKLQFQNRILKIRLEEAERNLNKQKPLTKQPINDPKFKNKQRLNDFQIKYNEIDQSLKTKSQDQVEQVVYIQWS